MASDVSRFYLLNVADTCAIWNVLSSRRLYAAVREAKCSLCCTEFVLYECLHKRRTNSCPEDEELKERLRREYSAKAIVSYPIDIADLQDIEIMEKRLRVSKGELSSIAFAKRTRQAFLTDDQKARRLATDVLASGMTQTTPHLFGWLFFTCKLSDGDKADIIKEHEGLKRPLREHFESMYLEALRCRLMDAAPAVNTEAHDDP